MDPAKGARSPSERAPESVLSGFLPQTAVAAATAGAVGPLLSILN
jgi:hypothetical protein